MKHGSEGVPSTDAPRLTQSDLRPADILLSRGVGLVSDLIAASDGGKYSHGALWSGTGVIQATGDGITHTEELKVHDVYRHRELDELGAAEVVEAAKAELPGSYAYGELVLLGLLFSLGLHTRGALLTRMLEAIGGEGATKLGAWLNAQAGKKTRVCTELVASSFFKVSNGRFALKILPRSERPLQPAVAAPRSIGLPPLVRGDAASGGATRGQADISSSAAVLAGAERARQTCLELLLANGVLMREGTRGALTELQPLTIDASVQTRKVFAGPIAVEAGTNRPIGVVTPADLQFSPSLAFLGRITG